MLIEETDITRERIADDGDVDALQTPEVTGKVVEAATHAALTRVVDTTVPPEQEFGPEGRFPTVDAYVREHAKLTQLNKMLKLADIVEQSKARIWSNMTVRICCSDGRIAQADFVNKQVTSRTLAHKYAPQAGALLISGTKGPGLGEFQTEAELHAFYEREESRINEVLRDRLIDDIRTELTWQKEYLDRTRSKKDMLERCVLEAELDGTPDSPALRQLKERLLGITNDITTVENKEIRIVFESHSDNSEYLAHPLDSETRKKSAHHGCGAHSNDMQAALAETVKQAYVTSLWLDDATRPHGETPPLLSPDEAAKVKIMRLHNFTVEQRLVLSPEVDTMALDVDGNIVELSPELVALGKRFVPSDPYYQPPRGRGAASLSKQNVNRHEEPVVRVSKDHLAHLFPGIQALELTPSPDFINTTTIERVLLSIMNSNYGKDHPDAPLVLHLDARELPETKLRPQWVNKEAHIAFKKDQITGMDALQMDPPWVEFVEEPITDEAELAEIRRKNAQERIERDAQLWFVYAFVGRREDSERMIEEKLAIIRTRFGASANTTVNQLLQIVETRDRDGTLCEEDAVRTRLLLEYVTYVRAFDRDAFLAAEPNEKRRVVLNSIADRLAVVRTRTNIRTFGVAFDEVEQPRSRAV